MKILHVLIVIFLFSSCSTPFPNQNPEGERFPQVQGTALDGKLWEMPRDFKEPLTILLLAYKQDAQFDVDRWLIGMDMRKVNLPVFELPTIKGLFPRMFSTTIDNGMRKGIPKDLWKGVITIYKDGERIQKFTGNQNPNNTRVILMNNTGQILFFNDQGFSVPGLNKLIQSIKDQD
jgi:hypothetical protein